MARYNHTSETRRLGAADIRKLKIIEAVALAGIPVSVIVDFVLPQLITVDYETSMKRLLTAIFLFVAFANFLIIRFVLFPSIAKVAETMDPDRFVSQASVGYAFMSSAMILGVAAATITSVEPLVLAFIPISLLDWLATRSFVNTQLVRDNEASFARLS